MALHNQAHPLHEQIVEQWQGMLAAIALAEVRGFPLKAQLVELKDLRDEDFADSLFELLPDWKESTLYTLTNKNPWQDIYIFLWDDKPVGMSSPSTLVVPSESGEWTDLPWWTSKNNITFLQSPQPYLNEVDQALLWKWLGNLNQELSKHNGNKDAINITKGLIGKFQSTLQQNQDQLLSLSDDPQFFGVPLNRGVLKALNRPVKAKEKESNVRLIPSREKDGEALPLLIIDPQIARFWDETPQNIWVHGGKTLASLPLKDLREGKLIWQNVHWIESHNLFLPELVFIDQEEALPGGLLPPITQPLNFNGQLITPLLPLNPILLDYFTPKDLVNKIVKFESFNNSEGAILRVILDLPLTGVNHGKPPENYRLYKDYPLKEENALLEVPVLEVWPNFRAKGWKEYYAFYYDGEYGDVTFSISLPEAQDSHLFKESLGCYQIVHLTEFPSFIPCENQEKELIGLILLATPEKTNLRGSWKVGVDFGTSFSNVYVSNSNNIPSPLRLDNLHLKVTDSNIETRN